MLCDRTPAHPQPAPSSLPPCPTCRASQGPRSLLPRFIDSCCTNAATPCMDGDVLLSVTLSVPRGHLCTIFLVPHDTGLCCVKSSPSCHALLVLTTTSPAQVSIPASPPPLRVKIWELWMQRNELRPLICCSSYSRMAPCTVPWQHQLPVPDGTRYLRLLSQLLFLILLPVISAIKHTFAVPAKTVQVTSATEHLLALSWLPHPTGSGVSARPGSSRFLRMVRQAEQQQEPIPLNRFIS